MKKFTILLILAVSVHSISIAQKKQISPSASFVRCFTMERVQKYMKSHPAAAGRANQATTKAPVKPTGPNGNRPTNVEDIVNVPVVFHIVLANPYLVTDEVVQSQVDELNTDFAGINADSTNGAAFYSVRGHSARIRFVLAKRTPDGKLTNGIDRVASSTGSNANLDVDPIKRASMGGADNWDPGSYLNYWVGNDVSGSGILGYAQFPGAGIDADDGIFCNYISFGISDCNISIYNKGRTLGHETGHYFGLFHIWGDDGAACSGDDFGPLANAGSTVVLPDSLANNNGQGNTSDDVGDTPNQAGNTTDCPSGVKTDACTSSAPGVMYEDYMDYTGDDCYSMFTKKQVARMEWILDNARSGLKTSLGGTVPDGTVTLDAAPYQSVNPGGSEALDCSSSVSYPSVLNCPGSIIPKVRIRNNGTSPLNSVSVSLTVNGVAQAPVNVTIPAPGLPTGGTIVVSFPSLSAAVGLYTLQFSTFNANGTPVDMVPSNDTLTATLNVFAGAPLPVFEGFQTLPFPSPNWSIYNPDGDASTWVRVTPGSNSTISMAIDNYSTDNTGNVDELRTPKFILPNADPVVITFDLAHKNYPGSSDELNVLVSDDCGVTWTSVYSKDGADLATAGSSLDAYITPIQSDWITQKITVPSELLTSGQILIAIRNTNDYGNNIFIDNINIYQQKARDISPVKVLSPGPLECSVNINLPQVTVINNGKEAVTAFKVGYILNGASPVVKSFTLPIAVGDTLTVVLPSLTAIPGTNTLQVFTVDPVTASGTGDLHTGDDTTTFTFKVADIVPAPLVEGFEGTTFPPVGWDLINPEDDNTWVRAPGGSQSSFSAFIDNYTNDFTGESDALKSPAVDVNGADSVVISFDLAHKYYVGAADELKIKVSTDCGNTYTDVFDKSGADLATAGSSTTAYIHPAPGDWKTQRIALGGDFLASGNVIVEIENTADFGNNIFIDNVNIFKLYKRDLQLVSITQPAAVLCTTGPTVPTVTIKNVGIDTITSYKVFYSIDNGAVATTTVTGVTLGAGQQADVNLDAFSSTVGSHTFKVFSFEPVSITGTGDQNPANDTLTSLFVIVGTQASLPLVEGFEGATFPPANWGVINPDGLTTWEPTSAAAKTGISSLVINNFSYLNGASNTVDKFVSPIITNSTKNDSVYVSFDLAYRQGLTYPGSTVFPLDTLEVQVTKDCGATFQTIWKKWGPDLQTVTDPNYSSVTSFKPVASDWKNVNLYISPVIGSNNFQVYFVAKSNKQNNIWLDNIDIYSKILPQKLKDQGYLIYPNPFTNTFLIHHYKVPVDLLAAQVFNSSGQMVWGNHYQGNASTEMTVNLNGLAKGVYVLKLTYQNRSVQEKLIKN